MSLGFPEMLFIFVLALIIFGPRKLPEIGRQIGKALAEFKRASNDFKSQIETEMRQLEIDEAVRKEKESLARALDAPSGTVAASQNEQKPAPAPEPEKAVPEYEDSYPDPYPFPPVEPPKSEVVKGTDA